MNQILYSACKLRLGLTLECSPPDTAQHQVEMPQKNPPTRYPYLPIYVHRQDFGPQVQYPT